MLNGLSLKKDGGKEIWAAHTLWIPSEDGAYVGYGGKEGWVAHALRGGPIYVGYVEPNSYSFSEAKEVCDNYNLEGGIEIELDGNSHRIQMTLPEIGFGHTDIDNPLNFEVLKYLNYSSVTSDEDRSWFWSRSPNWHSNAWAFGSAGGVTFYGGRDYVFKAARCVGG